MQRGDGSKFSTSRKGGQGRLSQSIQVAVNLFGLSLILFLYGNPPFLNSSGTLSRDLL